MLSRTGQTRMPVDSELTEAIRTNQTYNQRKTHVNLILTSVDDLSKESALLRQIAEKKLKLTIEHIMPQNLSAAWRQELGEDYEAVWEQYVHTLANLTLTGYNSELSNRSFAEKKKIAGGFIDSPLKINRDLKTLDKWDKTALQQRQLWWMRHLKKVWPLPISDFKPTVAETKISLLDEVNLLGSKVRLLHLLGDSYPVTSWAQVLDEVMERAFELDRNLYDKVIQDDFLANYIRTDRTRLIKPMQINELGIYAESNTNTNYKRMIIARVAGLMGWGREEVMVELQEPLS